VATQALSAPMRTAPPYQIASPAERMFGVGANEYERELSDCTLICCDRDLHAKLFALGIRNFRGRDFFDNLQSETVVFLDGGRFEFSKHLRNAAGSERAVIFPCKGALGDIVDLAAWQPDTGRLSIWHGRAAMLGRENILAPRLDGPLKTFATALEWLKAGRTGIVIVDAKRASDLLVGVTLAAADTEYGQTLSVILARPAPPIVVARRARAE
jgi:hypothetical protein